MEQEERWEDYNIAGSVASPRPRFLNALNRLSLTRGRGLDLGCGGGRDTREFLNRGWDVDAVDNHSSAVQLTSKLRTLYPGKIQIFQSRFEEISLGTEAYDMINASFSLFFCHPIHFKTFWSQILKSLKRGGVFSGELLGQRDSWTSNPNMTFLDKAQIQELLEGLSIEALTEEEYDLPSFSEPLKHWHIFTVTARRPVWYVAGIDAP